jgi:hypothetical protein
LSDDTTNREIALVRKEIKSDIRGLGELMSTRFTELGKRIDDIRNSNENQHSIHRKKFDSHDKEIDALTAWRNNVSGSVRPIVYILVAAGSIAGVAVIL